MDDASTGAETTVDQPTPSDPGSDTAVEVAVEGKGNVEQQVQGSTITFEAFPDAGWRFDRWTGDSQSLDNPLFIALGTVTELGAVFVRDDADALRDPDDPNDPDVVDPGDEPTPPADRDDCPEDPNKTAPGECGCGVIDADSDDDGLLDCNDNCPETDNPEQTDVDADGVGDACDPDVDGDGAPNDADACPLTSARAVVDEVGCADAQVDADADGACDPQAPGIGPSACQGSDNCPQTSNPLQRDTDGDGFGDECDADDDDDGVADEDDRCSETAPGLAVDAQGCADVQVDSDGDGICDPKAASAGPSVCTGSDNCISVANPEQTDLDGDGVGDDCDSDVDADGDGVLFAKDLCLNTASGAAVDVLGCSDAQVDGDGDGVCDPGAGSVGPSGCAGSDNCPTIANSSQSDFDQDGLGDACDPAQCGNSFLEDGETCDPPSCNACSAQCQTIDMNGTAVWSSLESDGVPFDTAWSGVWGSGPEDVFIVGGTLASGAIHHFNGATWNAMDMTTLPVDDIGFLVWVFGFGPDDVYAVGFGGAMIHYDGNASGQWSEITTPTVANLWGVWGAAPDDIWIVGGDAFSGDPVLLHYDGAGTVTAQTIPSHDRADAHALFKVWGVGSTVYAVGQNSLILQYTGGSWSQVPGIPDEVDDDLIALWGTGENNIVAVGGRSTGGLIVRYDGSGWTTTRYAGVLGLNAVYMTQSDEAIIGGTTFIGGGYAGSFDPTPAALTVADETTTAAQPIHALWSDCDGRYYGVGYDVSASAGAALVRTVEP